MEPGIKTPAETSFVCYTENINLINRLKLQLLLTILFDSIRTKFIESIFLNRAVTVPFDKLFHAYIIQQLLCKQR